MLSNLSLLLAILWAVALGAESETWVTLLLVNGAVQRVWFLLLAALPALRTGHVLGRHRLAPGVFFIGRVAAFLGDGSSSPRPRWHPSRHAAFDYEGP